jgi:cation diffusion facilitator family transporter
MSLTRNARAYILLSIGAAILTMALKFGAYALTGSIGLFSDAAESLVNLVAAVAAFIALTYAARPPDLDHAYGHTKAEYFSSAIEGALVLVAAGMIVYQSVPRLIHPQPLEQIGLGLTLAVVGAAINGGVALVLLSAGRRLRSIALDADAHHLLADVWTTVGVLVAVMLIALTHWNILDPLIALVVAANVVWTGLRLLRETSYGLLDTALPVGDQLIIRGVLARFTTDEVGFHALRTRRSGTRRFVSMHVLVPGTWTVKQGHDLLEEIEAALREALPEASVFTHLEPREDPLAFADQELDRKLDRAPGSAAGYPEALQPPAV